MQTVGRSNPEFFDRVTGEPIWPIEEKLVPNGDVPGEWYAPTQPHPPAALMYGRNAINGPDDLIGFTPEMRAQALKNLERYRWFPGVVGQPFRLREAAGTNTYADAQTPPRGRPAAPPAAAAGAQAAPGAQAARGGEASER